MVQAWADPHLPKTIHGCVRDEIGWVMSSPIGKHTSNDCYIKHIYCRSLEEWKEKMTRGSGDRVQRERKLEDWYEYNKRCNLEE